jgi:hypothetical protein
MSLITLKHVQGLLVNPDLYDPTFVVVPSALVRQKSD